MSNRWPVAICDLSFPSMWCKYTSPNRWCKTNLGCACTTNCYPGHSFHPPVTRPPPSHDRRWWPNRVTQSSVGVARLHHPLSHSGWPRHPVRLFKYEEMMRTTSSCLTTSLSIRCTRDIFVADSGWLSICSSALHSVSSSMIGPSNGRGVVPES
jgi:hypothetical protein